MLFRRSDIRTGSTDEELGAEQPGAVRVAGSARSAIGHKQSSLQDIIGVLTHNEHVHVPSFARWSMHDVLIHILQQTGPANVWITSWTITEEPVRAILEEMAQGRILSLKALFSERVEAMNPAAHQLARFSLQVKLTKIHAKCIVVLNEQWGVTVSGSANFTRNPRIEKYVICTHRDQAIEESTWIDAVMNGAKPFDHE